MSAGGQDMPGGKTRDQLNRKTLELSSQEMVDWANASVERVTELEKLAAYDKLIIDDQRIKIERLTEALDNERASGIHSCGPKCQRDACKERRELEAEHDAEKQRAWYNHELVVARLNSAEAQVKLLKGDLSVANLQLKAKLSSS